MKKPIAASLKKKLNFIEFNRIGNKIAIPDGAKIYTAIVNCVSLKRDVRIVYLVSKTESRLSFALPFSTDAELDALSIVRYYQARFQIEFLFRDAKQFTGLMDCQSRSEQALLKSFNASFAALNLHSGTIGSCRRTEN